MTASAEALPRLGCGSTLVRWQDSPSASARHQVVARSREYLTPASAAHSVEAVLAVIEGRWKLVILFHLFGGTLRRFSELERAIPAVSQKMLIQQLRHLERDGIVRRIVHPQVPPKVEYGLTDWGQALCPALDALLKWAASRAKLQPATADAADFTHRAGL
jgi:DNA-binding HxlR family transcriptional regulator